MLHFLPCDRHWSSLTWFFGKHKLYHINLAMFCFSFETKNWAKQNLWNSENFLIELPLWMTLRRMLYNLAPHKKHIIYPNMKFSSVWYKLKIIGWKTWDVLSDIMEEMKVLPAWFSLSADDRGKFWLLFCLTGVSMCLVKVLCCILFHLALQQICYAMFSHIFRWWKL